MPQRPTPPPDRHGPATSGHATRTPTLKNEQAEVQLNWDKAATARTNAEAVWLQAKADALQSFTALLPEVHAFLKLVVADAGNKTAIRR